MINLEKIKANKADNAFYVDANSPELFFIGGNRPTKLAHVKKIKNALIAEEFLPPIIIDQNTLAIVDGQHRYSAAQMAWSEGHNVKLTVIINDFANPLLAAIQFNSNSKRWSATDYVEAYIIDGNENYMKLKEFADSHPMTVNKYRLCQYLLLDKENKIGDGKLVLNDEIIAEAEIIRRELQVLMDASVVLGGKNGSLRLIQKENARGWIAVRKEILQKQSVEQYAIKFQKKFTFPADGKITYQVEYLKVK